MSKSAEINYISKIDFSKGFKRFHITWPLKNLKKPKLSSIFNTVVINDGGKITLSWSLGVTDSGKDSTKTWFAADLKSSGKISPVIYRMCLSSSTNVLFDRIDFMVVDGTVGSGRNVLSSELDAYPIDDLMLQFWIDIPNAIVIGNNSDKLKEAKGDLQGQNTIQKANDDAFLFDHAKMFSRVVSASPDPLSDVSVLIVNKKDEELRRFHCHTIFLSGRSDVFERMFALEEWKENCVKDGRSVKIKDINAQVMETVLQYIYTSALPDPSTDHDHLCGIIFAADKYNLKELKNWCVGVLIRKHASAKCRIEQLILADRHNLAQLKSVCIANLSLGFSASLSAHAKLKDIPTQLWSEIMEAVSDRQMKTAHIILSAA